MLSATCPYGPEQVDSGMLTPKQIARADALTDTLLHQARSPWVDRDYELRRAWNGTDPHTRHLLLLAHDIHTGAEFVAYARERLRAEDCVARARAFAYAGAHR
jgi:hypothetical protein